MSDLTELQVKIETVWEGFGYEIQKHSDDTDTWFNLYKALPYVFAGRVLLHTRWLNPTGSEKEADILEDLKDLTM